MQASPPEPLQRNEFDRWLWERDIDNVAAGRELGLHPLTVGRYRKPFGHSERRTPDVEALARIKAYTGGEIDELAFVPPHLRPGYVAPDAPAQDAAA